MKSGLILFVLVLVCFAFQTTVVPSFFETVANVTGLRLLSGRSIDLVLLTLIYLSLHRDSVGAVCWGVIFGVMSAWFGLGWKGAQSAGLLVTAVAGAILNGRVLLNNMGSVSLLVAGLTILEGLVHLNIGHLFSGIPGPMLANMGDCLVVAVLNALFAPVWFFFLTWLDRLLGEVSGVRRKRSLLDY